MSYNSNYHHIVFRTKCSRSTIPEEHKRKLFSFIFEMCKREGWFLKQVNAYLNHVHLLMDFPVSTNVTEAVRMIKSRTSQVFSRDPDFPYFEGWAKGYASFSISYYEVRHIRSYIKSQEVHHQKVGFEEEFESLLRENGIMPDEYMFKD